MSATTSRSEAFFRRVILSSAVGAVVVPILLIVMARLARDRALSRLLKPILEVLIYQPAEYVLENVGDPIPSSVVIVYLVILGVIAGASVGVIWGCLSIRRWGKL